MTRNDIDPAAVEDVVFGCPTPSSRRPATSRVRASSWPGSPRKSQARPSTGNADQANRPSASRLKDHERHPRPRGRRRRPEHEHDSHRFRDAARQAAEIQRLEINEASLRLCSPGSKSRGRPREGQRQRRRDRARSSSRSDGCPAHDHPPQRAETHRWSLRPPNHVRGRRPGQRHDHRTAESGRSISGSTGVLESANSAISHTTLGSESWQERDELAASARHAS